MSYFNKTEEQQFNDVKEWLKQNGLPIGLAIVVGIGVSVGWKQWKEHKTAKNLALSESYQLLIDNSSNEVAPEKLKQFAENNSETVYATFSYLVEAKKWLEKNDFEQAEIALNGALKSNSSPVLKEMIYFRLAQVQYQLQHYDQALNLLTNINSKAWQFSKQELTGDILSAKGDKLAAKSAYEQSLSLASEQQKILLEVKINNL